MPDKHGFDHLPDWGAVDVRCIWCGAGGAIFNWPERLRERHARAHRRDVTAAREAARREKDMIENGEVTDG
jgi:hypothetical protein